MSKKHDSDAENIDEIDILDDEDSESDDIIEIQLVSNIIEVSYPQLIKYSYFIKNKCTIDDAKEYLTQNLQKYETDYDIKERNIILFFKYIEEDKNISITISNFWDFNVLSCIFKVKKYISELKKFSISHADDISFISNLVNKQNSKNFSYFFNKIDDDTFDIDIEDILKNRINECFENDEFKKLPISVIYKIVKDCEENLKNDNLCDFVIESIEERCELFELLNLRSLSTEKFNKLYDIYSNEKVPRKYFEYLRLDLKYLKELQECQEDKLIEQNKQLLKENNDLMNQERELKKNLKILNDDTHKMLKDSEDLKINSHKQINSIKDENNQLIKENENRRKKIEDLNKIYQSKIKSLDNKKRDLNKLPLAIQKKANNFTNIILFLAQNVPDIKKMKHHGILNFVFLIDHYCIWLALLVILIFSSIL